MTEKNAGDYYTDKANLARVLRKALDAALSVRSEYRKQRNVHADSVWSKRIDLIRGELEMAEYVGD